MITERDAHASFTRSGRTFTTVFTPHRLPRPARGRRAGPEVLSVPSGPVDEVRHVIAQLEEVLRHQRDALVHLDVALTDVEHQLAGDDPPALRAALVAVRAAADRTAALELTRCLALLSAGASPDLSLEAIGQALVARSGPRAAHLAAELRAAVDEVTARRRRILEALESRCGAVPAVDLGRPPRA